MAFNSKAQEAERYMDLCKFKTSHSYIVRPHLKTTNIKTKQNNNHQGVRLERWLSVVKSTDSPAPYVLLSKHQMLLESGEVCQ